MFAWGPAKSRVVIITLSKSVCSYLVEPALTSAQSIFQFPQSVGILGGQTSSSCYFVGTQGDGLFYLDPYPTRPASILQPPPSVLPQESVKTPVYSSSAPVPVPVPVLVTPNNHKETIPLLHIGSKFEQRYLRDKISNMHLIDRPYSLPVLRPSCLQPLIQGGANSQDGRHYCGAYDDEVLSQFHCDNVQDMPLRKLGPSMVLGFICRNEDEWSDFKVRVEKVSPHGPIYSILN
jgi:cysteine protease ATG4